MAMTDHLRFVRTELEDAAGEKTSPKLEMVLVDEDENPINGAVLESLRLTLYDKASGTIINNVDSVDILNTGRGTIDSSGNLVIHLLPNDLAMVDTTKAKEQHAAYLRWVWDSGNRAGGHILFHTVYNFLKAV